MVTKEKVRELIQDKGYVMENVLPRLMSTSDERYSILKGDSFLDLKVLYYIDLDGATATLGLNNLNQIGVTEDEIRSAAMSNLKKSTTSKSLFDILAGVGFADLPTAEPETMPLYVLTTDKPRYGSAAILDKDFLKALSNGIMGGDFYILPSSVHEMIAVPATNELEPSDLRKMVSTINKDVVEDQDVLTDSVYLYNKALDSIQIAG